MRKLNGLILGVVVIFGFMLCPLSLSFAAAPLRTNQPYAETAKCADPDVIFCEDFNYPENFYYSGVVDRNNSDWINPGLTTGLFGFIYGLEGRRINPTSDYSPQPVGSPTGGYVWVANWDSTKGPTGHGSTVGKIREPRGNYANGMPPAKDLYFRFQYYVTPNYAWPGDPKIDKYNYGAPWPVIDNKIFYIFPPEGIDNPTSAAYDAGLHTQSGIYDPINNARFADALAVRVGDASDSYKHFPMDVDANSNPQHMEYAPFQSMTLRNPNDQPILGRIFRFNTNKWYTVEMRYKLISSAGAEDGIVEVWIDGTKIYSANDLATCGYGLGDCSGIGAINIVAYHNVLDTTKWDGQQVIDNLIVSRAYIGPPSNSAPSNSALRFYGNGTNDIDRIKIQIDDPVNNNSGPPADVGAEDFALEFWMKGASSENTAGAVACGANINWIYGNTIIDRDRFNQNRKFGLSIANGRPVFGVSGDTTGNLTICGTTNTLDNQWHHVVVERRRLDGWMWLYVDGNLEAEADGPDGDISYPDNGVPGSFCGPAGTDSCTNSDPYLVIGAEKHDAGSQYPSFSGWVDELRISNRLRYAANFSKPTLPFITDPNTVALYHFDEGSGDVINDTSGASGGPSNGIRKFGGTPSGPAWVASDVFLLDNQTPLTPTNLTATAISSSQINLSWTASTDDVGVTGYRLERCQGLTCTNFTQISSPAVTTYSDTGLSPNTTYRYQVRAVDGAGNLSGYSAISSATTQPADTLKGDVQCDKLVDVLDVQALVNCILGTGDCDWGCGNSADVNQDGSVDVLDIQEVVNIILVP